MNDNTNSTGSVSSGYHKTYWLDTAPQASFGKIESDIKTDVLVIGGGIAGLTTAYFLLKAGKKVVLVEDGFLGSGESGRTTAHLTCALDDRYYFLENIFGQKAASLAAESHMSAIGAIENIVTAEHIDCHFMNVTGYLFLDPSDDEKNLNKELDATNRAGIKTKLLGNIPGLADGNGMQCLEFPNQAQFHILKYLTGLSKAIVSMGGTIYTETKAEQISSSGAKANGFTVNAEQIIVATNSPVNDIITMHTKQHAYRTYAIAGKIRKGQLPHALWWDTGNADSKWVSQPYHYVRLEPLDETYDLLISGGEDHKTGQADEEHIPEMERYARLETWTRKHFPELETILYQWSGQVMEPVDSLGFMGKNPGDDNIYIITGDSGNGMTHTTIGAMIIRDSIMGIRNKWADLYDPARITFKTSGDFLKEAGNMASQYLDWVLPSDLKEAESLKPGEGGILTSNLRKIAVYRDKDNMLHAYSAVCPHLGCIVQWNADEKSFDCPCHGSRFTCHGIVTNGPAQTNLEKLSLEK
jgi:glycine/D-amino acid oxidase-like deaminating enzyme/nitrite reductase/ring-hydroxylating ferredoxin subunit